MSNRTKLSVMMFLEFFIWGAWLPKIFGYLGKPPDGLLGFNTMQQALVLNAFAVGSILALFFSNQFADRNFSAEKFLAFSHLVGGLAIMALTWVTDFWAFFLLMLVHTILYVPTISITNSIAFAHVKDAQKEFGLIRLWGTIGWIAASVPMYFILMPPADAAAPVPELPAISASVLPDTADIAAKKMLDEAARNILKLQTAAATRYIFLVAGIASLLLAAYSLVLPHTPPKPAHNVEEKFAWLESMLLLRKPFMLVLFLVTFVDSIVHTCYFVWTDRYLMSIGIESKWVMPAMSVGQIAEIGTMALLGYCLKALGWRYTMVIGILGHAVRFAVFAWLPFPGAAVAINLLHGICYAFFFATVYIFVDEFFPKDARASAQGLFNFMILGIGPLVGYFLWPYLGNDVFNVPGSEPGKTTPDFEKLFLVPAGVALVAAVSLFLFFHVPEKARAPADKAAEPQPA